MKIVDGKCIKATLHDYMLRAADQPATFLVEIRVNPGEDWNGHPVGVGGLIIEGAKPMSAATFEDGECVYTLTNSDSDYRSPIGQVRLAGIQSVETLDWRDGRSHQASGTRNQQV